MQDMRARHIPRPDRIILSNGPDLDLLRAVAGGRVLRIDDDGHTGSPAIMAGHFLAGRSVRLELRLLAADDLIEMPISGPPRLAARGQRLLSIANGEVAATGYE
jgi:hypothetical protein